MVRESSCGYPVAGSIHILFNILIRYIRNIIKTIVIYIQNPGSNSVFFYALASLITCCEIMIIIATLQFGTFTNVTIQYIVGLLYLSLEVSCEIEKSEGEGVVRRKKKRLKKPQNASMTQVLLPCFTMNFLRHFCKTKVIV